MDLIYEKWIPVRLADGTPDKIAPYEITREIENEKRRIVAVASPRPDFDGALTQFLIGLLQTACTPETEGKWWDWRESPPPPERLKEQFEPYKDAFYLFGDGKSWFMQENLASTKNAKLHPVSYLLIGAATDNALKTNTDHFQKRPKGEEAMCSSCAAAALYTLQTFAPSGGGGGDGKFTSLRGGGPLTTIILGKNLWETVWLNVLVKGDFDKKPCNEKTFPWLKLGHFLSEKAPVKSIHSSEMNSVHVYWGMPRRIQLQFSEVNTPCLCSVCGDLVSVQCRQYHDLSGGLTYQDGKGSKKGPSWISPLHPLSPYNIGEDNKPSAVHPQSGGIGYRHWLSYIENTAAGNFKRMPAKVIEQFRTIVREDGRMWAFGFDIASGQNKARCWYDSTMPILYIPSEQTSLLMGHATNMVNSSRYVSGLILSSIFKATMMEPVSKDGWQVIWNWPKDLLCHLKTSDQEKTESVKAKISVSGEELESRIEKNLLSKPISIRNQFWSETEKGYFTALHQIREALLSGAGEDDTLVKWLKLLQETAHHIFDIYSQDGDFDAVSPRSVALARNELTFGLNGNFLRKKLGLPIINHHAP